MNKPLSRTELDFIIRAISDVQHVLVATNGMMIQEQDCEPFKLDNTQDVALLELVLRLLGENGTPPLLERQFGFRAALEARGDLKAIELYEQWQQAGGRR